MYMLFAELMAKHLGTHGTTFGGSPLACALGHYVLSKLKSPGTLNQITESSRYLIGRLEQLTRLFPDIVESRIRGRGLILGLGFKNANHPGRVVEMARERGVLLLTAGKDAVRLVPSLTIGRGEVDEAVDVLEACVGKVN